MKRLAIAALLLGVAAATSWFAAFVLVHLADAAGMPRPWGGLAIATAALALGAGAGRASLVRVGRFVRGRGAVELRADVLGLAGAQLAAWVVVATLWPRPVPGDAPSPQPPPSPVERPDPPLVESPGRPPPVPPPDAPPPVEHPGSPPTPGPCARSWVAALESRRQFASEVLNVAHLVPCASDTPPDFAYYARVASLVPDGEAFPPIRVRQRSLCDPTAPFTLEAVPEGAYDRCATRPAAAAGRLFERLADTLVAWRFSSVVVHGHTDRRPVEPPGCAYERGRIGDNDLLSAERARVVRDLLRRRWAAAGVPAEIVSIGHGSDEPPALDVRLSDEARWARERRVVVTVAGGAGLDFDARCALAP